MILVITPETLVHNETEVINQMFQEGLDLLHIRKPWITNDEMLDFIEHIDEEFHNQLVLHSHYELGRNHDISRFHFREESRKEGNFKAYMNENVISTSVHDISTYNTLEKEWEYAFMSPFFPSISKKGYGEDSTMMEDMKQRSNPNVKLIALGGIAPNNIREVFEKGVNGVALLGAIWESHQPLKVFEECRKNTLL